MATLADMLRGWSDSVVNFPTEAQRFIVSPTSFLDSLTGKTTLPSQTGFAQGATGTPEKENLTVLDPTNRDYKEGYNLGEPVSYAATLSPFAKPTAVLAGKALGPKAYQMAEDYMINQGFAKPITAWHGSPHSFEVFDVAKGGTGQGTQNYGHGTYFAENPRIAEGYMGRTVIQEPKLERFTFNGPDYTIANGQYLKSGKPITEDEYKKAFEGIQGLWNTQNKGSLYKVDIPDESIPKMLNWYEQVPESVRKNISEKAMDKWGSGVSDTSGEKLYKEIVFNFKQSGSKNPQADASKWLAEQGVPGIKYENFQIKKGEGAGTHNYVVFDPIDVKMLEKNGEPISRKDLIEEQINKLK